MVNLKLNDMGLRLLIVFLGIVGPSMNILAQDKPFKTNLIKVNILPLPVRSYQISYETKWRSNMSLNIHSNFRPSDGFPFRDNVEDYYTDDDIAYNNTRISYFSLAPELRYYFLDTDMRGFYASTFLYYARAGISSQLDIAGTSTPVPFSVSGAIHSLNVGIGFGYQWRLSSKMYLDWQIVAPYFGVNKGKITGSATNGALTDGQQVIVEGKPQEFDIPLAELTVNATGTYIDARTKGYWAGSRFGLSIGYRF